MTGYSFATTNNRLVDRRFLLKYGIQTRKAKKIGQDRQQQSCSMHITLGGYSHASHASIILEVSRSPRGLAM